MQCKNPQWMVSFNKAGEAKFGANHWFFRTNEMLANRAYITKKILISCGMCMACRINYTTEWKNRLLAEAKEHEKNYFLTLTYTDEAIPSNPIVAENGEVKTDINDDPVIAHPLKKKDLQDFNKRLRRHWVYNYHHKGIRHFGVGEYGDKSGRPHYHEILFNCPIHDLQEIGVEQKVKFGKTVQYKTYFSKTIQKLWPHGKILIGEFNDTTAGYVAGYAVKKQKGKNAKKWYKDRGLEPEFSISSRRPGIGFNYFDEHRHEMIEKDRLLMSDAWGGVRVPVPKGFQQAAIRVERAPEYNSKGEIIKPRIKARYNMDEVEEMRKIRDGHKPRKEMAAEAYMEQMLHNSSLSPEEQLRVNAEALERKMRTMKGIF